MCIRLKILGRFWRLRFLPKLPDRAARGACDPPSYKNKEIRIWDKLRDEERLEVILHELVHAAGWHIDEEFVKEFASDAARALWRLGYRESKEVLRETE